VRRLRVTRWHVFVALAVVAGIVLRVVVYRSTLGNTNADEGLIGVMVLHALHGHLAAFQWGQAYGGTQEVLLAVPVFWAAGAGLLSLRLVSVALGASAAILVWRVGLRTIGEPAATAAALILWLWPPRTIDDLLHEEGFYGTNLLYCALVLLVVLRAKERPDAVRVALVGLVSGLAIWQSAQVAPIVIPAVAWLVWRQRRVLRYAWAAVLLAAVGAAPAIVWNIRHDWGSLHVNPGAHLSYLQRLRVFVSPIFPAFLGLRASYSIEWIVPAALGVALYAGLVVLFGYGAYRARRKDELVIYLVVAAFPFLYAASPKANLPTDPRYAIVIAPCLALLLAQLGSTYVRAVAIVTLALLVSALSLRHSDAWATHHATPPDTLSTPRSIAPLIASLDRLGVRRVFANYWIAFRLDFETKERIVAAQNAVDSLSVHDGDVLPGPAANARYRPYDRTVRAGPHAFVFFRSLPPSSGEVRTLTQNGYVRDDVEGFVIYARSRAG